MPRPSHPPCFDHPNNTGRRVQTMQLLRTDNINSTIKKEIDSLKTNLFTGPVNSYVILKYVLKNITGPNLEEDNGKMSMTVRWFVVIVICI
jgi:hypothetical protein